MGESKYNLASRRLFGYKYPCQCKFVPSKNTGDKDEKKDGKIDRPFKTAISGGFWIPDRQFISGGNTLP